MTLRVLMVHSSDELYGSDGILHTLATEIDRARFEAIVVLPRGRHGPGPLWRALEEAGVRVVASDLAVLRRKHFHPFGVAGLGIRLVRSGRALARLIRDEHIDVVHSHTSAVLSGAAAARLSGRPHVWQLLEIIVSPRLLWRAMARLMPRLSSRIVCASGPTRDHLVAGNPRCAGTSEVIHYGIDVVPVGSGDRAGVRADWRVPEDVPLVGLVGRINSWKGQDLLVRAARDVLPRHPDAWFVMVGDPVPGNEALWRELEDLARSEGVAERVVLAGFRHDIPDVLAALDVFVMGSTRPDPFPTTVLEAMAAGLPVVACAHGGSVEMVADGETGLLVAPDDPAAMADGIARLLDDRERARAMGAAGRERVMGRFPRSAYVRGFERVYSAATGMDAP